MIVAGMDFFVRAPAAADGLLYSRRTRNPITLAYRHNTRLGDRARTSPLLHAAGILRGEKMTHMQKKCTSTLGIAVAFVPELLRGPHTGSLLQFRWFFSPFWWNTHPPVTVISLVLLPVLVDYTPGTVWCVRLPVPVRLGGPKCLFGV